jgi:hypothetical protein
MTARYEIKTLQWDDDSCDYGDGDLDVCHSAECLGYSYYVKHTEFGWHYGIIDYQGFGSEIGCESLEDGKAKCEQLYRERLQEALTSPDQSEALDARRYRLIRDGKVRYKSSTGVYVRAEVIEHPDEYEIRGNDLDHVVDTALSLVIY